MKVVESLQAYAALSRQERLFTYLVEDAAAMVALESIDEPLVDIRTMDGHFFSYDSSLPDPRLRRATAERLATAGGILQKKGFVLEVCECFRPYEKQKREFDAISASMQELHVHLSGKELWRKVTEFIADPDLCPPHLTGGAVDVRLRRFDGTIVDMGTEVNSLSSAAALMSTDIAPEAVENRRVLLDVFLDVGFAPMPSEWWHFSYGDRYWGAFYDRAAFYDVFHS